MRADHGYNMDSAAIRGLINIMSTYDVPSRRQFLQFITGKSPFGCTRVSNINLLASFLSMFDQVHPNCQLGASVACILL
jgi:hypothetical protein